MKKSFRFIGVVFIRPTSSFDVIGNNYNNSDLQLVVLNIIWILSIEFL